MTKASITPRMPYFAKRLASLLVGLAVESFGIALITKSNLGTSPISSMPGWSRFGSRKSASASPPSP